MFTLRMSNRRLDQAVLSVVHQGVVLHYDITQSTDGHNQAYHMRTLPLKPFVMTEDPSHLSIPFFVVGTILLLPNVQLFALASKSSKTRSGVTRLFRSINELAENYRRSADVLPVRLTRYVP